MSRLRPLLRLYPRARHFSTRRPSGGEVSPGGGRQADLSGLGPTRFYDHVDVSAQPDGSFAVTLDSKVVLTPLRSALAAPTLALATAVAAEWDAQSGRLRPSSMPLTTLMSTALDVIPDTRARVITAVMTFLDTDTVCIRPEHPAELVAAQDAVFAPIVEHLEAGRGVRLNVVRGGLQAPQGERAREVFEGVVEGLDDCSLAAMDLAAASSKSVAVAMALRDGAVTATQALEAARSEERWQMRVWGEVEGGHDLEDADVLVRLSAADAVFRFVDMEPEKFPRSEKTER